MGSSFKEFLESLQSKQPDAWKRFFNASKIIVEHMAEKEMLELNWASSPAKEVLKFDLWFDELFSKFKDEFENYSSEIRDFDDLKNVLMKLVYKRINELFQEFCKALVLKNEKTWVTLNHNLHQRMIFWIVRESKLNNDDAKLVYQEGLSLFFEKMTSSRLTFNTSRNLKSYLIRIFEYKVKELKRSKLKHSNYIAIDNYSGIDNLLSGKLPDNDPGDDIVQLIMEQIQKLDTIEKQILINSIYKNEKLKSIAQNLGISVENCRVIKFRALNKIKVNLKDITIGV